MTESQTPSRRAYDAIVVGAGHNGLTAAAYLARGGLSTLVLERRAIVGGACVTEEIAPGCRASTTSYIASMLRPEVIRDLELAAHGLRDGPVRSGAARAVSRSAPSCRGGRTASGRCASSRSSRSATRRTFVRVDDELKRLARYLQPFFLEPPPDVGARGLAGLLEALRVGRRFRNISASEVGRMVSFLTGSLGDFLDRNYESEKVKTLFLANNVYGKHGGPYSPGHRPRPSLPPAVGRRARAPGLLRPRARRHGLDHAGHGLGCPEVRRRDRRLGPGRLDRRARRTRPRGHARETARRSRRRVVVSNADPKRTFLGLVGERALPGGVPRPRSPASRWTGPARRSTSCSRRSRGSTGCRPASPAPQRSLFTLVPSLEFAERCYDTARSGEIPEELWVDCVVASNVDPSLAPEGRHVMTTASSSTCPTG